MGVSDPDHAWNLLTADLPGDVLKARLHVFDSLLSGHLQRIKP